MRRNSAGLKEHKWVRSANNNREENNESKEKEKVKKKNRGKKNLNNRKMVRNSISVVAEHAQDTI